jgi:putative PIN family toxin of toxin-antitoxin system
MIFFQWAALPNNRQHATVKALYDGSIRLCLSEALFDEVQEVLSRPEVRAKAPNLTPERLKEVLAAALERADWIADIPNAFNWAQHPDDDHAFNLAIAARAEYLVTWEDRILKLSSDESSPANRLRALAPQLKIVTPKELAERLKSPRK